MKTQAIINGTVRDLYKKNGLLKSLALHEGFANRKSIRGGYVGMYRAPDTWVVRGFNPKFFFEDFYDIREAERFYKSLR